MTYKRSSADHPEALALTAPQQLWRGDDLLSDPKRIPASSGLYAAWLDVVPGAAAPASIWLGGWGLAYIGVAGGRGRGSLRKRLRQHLKGDCAHSTLRRALAALLREQLDLEPDLTASGKIKFKELGEARLSAWLGAHARWSWIEHPAPASLEQALIQSFAPPLNIAGAFGEARDIVRAERARLRERAIALAGGAQVRERADS
jgi:hypothetical protein